MKRLEISPITGATVVNLALVVTAGALCWKLKRMAPALMLLFMVSAHSRPRTVIKSSTERTIPAQEPITTETQETKDGTNE